MYRLKKFPTQQEVKSFILAEMGLDWPNNHPDMFNRIKALLLDPDLASKLRANMVDFYTCLLPEFLVDLYPETHCNTGLTPGEFKYQLLKDMIAMPLNTWVEYQTYRLDAMGLWDLI